MLSSYAYYRYTDRAGSPGAGQGIYFIYLLPYGIPEDTVTDSVDEGYPHSPMLHILVQDALEIFNLIWQFKALRGIIS